MLLFGEKEASRLLQSLISLGLFLLIIRCMFPLKAAAQTRPPRRRARPNRVHDSRLRPTSGGGRTAAVWTSGTPPSDLENQTLSHIIAQLEEGRARALPCRPPPSYSEAIGYA